MIDETILGHRSKHEAQMDALREYLRQANWNFSVGHGSFDDFSEGACILSGIDPWGSMQSSEHYGPKFLPGGLEHIWGLSIPLSQESRALRECVDGAVSKISRLGLTGRQTPDKALKTAVSGGLKPPWLDVASSMRDCAELLPIALITNEDIRTELISKKRARAGRSRANKNAKTRILEEECYQEFLRLEKKGFKGHLFKSSGRPNANSIADEIYRRVIQSGEHSQNDVPSPTAVQTRVRSWLKK